MGAAQGAEVGGGPGQLLLVSQGMKEGMAGVGWGSGRGGGGTAGCFQSSEEAGAQMYTRPSAQSPAILQDTQQPGGRNGGSEMTA